MEIFFAGLMLLYCLLVVRFHYYWLQIPLFKYQRNHIPNHSNLKVSVIIPVRNESAHIVSLLKDLEKQQLDDSQLMPTDCWEVIVVDDHSEDNTAELVKGFQFKTTIALQLLSADSLKKNFSPKKAALWKGIQSAQGNVIVTTDGDCRVGPYWLATWMDFFSKYQPAVVAGGVTFHCEKSWFQKLQTIEFASLIGMGAASIQSGQPITCNGANLAFSRQAFTEVGGYEGHWHIPSGDDEFLLQAVFRKFPNRVHFLKSPEAMVRTYAKRSLYEFIQQRKRWAGKWKMHRAGPVAALALLIFTFHLMLSGGLIYWVVYGLESPWLGWLLLLKAGVEFAFLKSVLSFLKKKLNLANFLGLQLLYSAYFVFIGMAATLGGYTWKNRNHASFD